MPVDGDGQGIRVYLNGVCIEITDGILQPSTSPEEVLNEHANEVAILTLAKKRIYVNIKPHDRKMEYVNVALTAGILLMSILAVILVLR